MVSQSPTPSLFLRLASALMNRLSFLVSPPSSLLDLVDHRRLRRSVSMGALRTAGRPLNRLSVALRNGAYWAFCMMYKPGLCRVLLVWFGCSQQGFQRLSKDTAACVRTVGVYVFEDVLNDCPTSHIYNLIMLCLSPCATQSGPIGIIPLSIAWIA